MSGLTKCEGVQGGHSEKDHPDLKDDTALSVIEVAPTSNKNESADQHDQCVRHHDKMQSVYPKLNQPPLVPCDVDLSFSQWSA